MKPRKTKSGTWRVDFREDGRGRTRTFRTFAQADAFIADLKAAQRRGTWIDTQSQRTPVGEFLDRYMADRRHTLAASSRYSYEAHMKNHLKPRWERVEVGQVRHRDVQDWVNDLSDTLAPKTVRTIAAMLSGAFAIAVREKCVSESPCDGVRLPRVQRREKTFLTPAQLQRLVDEANGDKKTLVRLQAATGMRWGEVAGLQVRDFDFAAHRVTVARQAVTIGRRVEVTETLKTNSSRRVIAFPTALDEELRDLMAGKAAKDFLFTKPGSADPLRRPEGKKSWLGCAVARIQAEDPSFPDVSTHDLRHTAVSLMVSAGAPVTAIARQVGHAKTSMTLDVYAELMDSDLDSLSSGMDAILG